MASNPQPKSRPRPPSLRLHDMGVDPSVLVGKIIIRSRRSQHHPALTLDFSDNTTYQVLIDGYDPVHKGTPKFLQTTGSLHSETCSQDPEYLVLNPPTCDPVEAMIQIVDCAYVRLSDKAFKREDKLTRDMEEDLRGRRMPTDEALSRQPYHETKWDQHHIAVAFKFKTLHHSPSSPEDDMGMSVDSESLDQSAKHVPLVEVKPKWNCIWATMEEYAEENSWLGSRECIFRSYDDVYLHQLHRHPCPSPTKGAFAGSHWNNGAASTSKRRRESRSSSPTKGPVVYPTNAGDSSLGHGSFPIPIILSKKGRTNGGSDIPWPVSSGSPTKFWSHCDRTSPTRHAGRGHLDSSGSSELSQSSPTATHRNSWGPLPNRNRAGSPTKPGFNNRHRRNNSSRSSNHSNTSGGGSNGNWVHDMAPSLEDEEQ